MPISCRGCGSFHYDYGFHFTDSRGCKGIMCDRCMAAVIGFHQNGEGERCDKCGRVFPPGQVGSYTYKGEHHNWCEACKRKVIFEWRLYDGRNYKQRSKDK